jgi:hypothetical protein
MQTSAESFSQYVAGQNLYLYVALITLAWLSPALVINPRYRRAYVGWAAFVLLALVVAAGLIIGRGA